MSKKRAFTSEKSLATIDPLPSTYRRRRGRGGAGGPDLDREHLEAVAVDDCDVVDGAVVEVDRAVLRQPQVDRAVGLERVLGRVVHPGRHGVAVGRRRAVGEQAEVVDVVVDVEES